MRACAELYTKIKARSILHCYPMYTQILMCPTHNSGIWQSTAMLGKTAAMRIMTDRVPVRTPVDLKLLQLPISFQERLQDSES